MTPALTLLEAQRTSRCRICGEHIDNQGCPRGWQTTYDRQLLPESIILHFGKEFAHQRCWEALQQETQVHHG